MRQKMRLNRMYAGIGMVAVAEMILLAVIVLPLFRAPKTYSLMEETSVEAEAVESERVNLGRGIYTFTMDYRMEFRDEETPEDATLVFYQDGIRGRPLERSYPCLISVRERQVSGRILLGDYASSQFFARVTCAGSEYLRISSLDVTYQRGLSVLHALLKWSAVFMLCNVLLYIFVVPSSHLRAWLSLNRGVVFLCLLSVFVASLPLIRQTLPDGHDIEFHVYRIRALAASLSTFDVAARIQPGWLGGYGYAVATGYGQLLMYPFALLYLCGFSAEVCYRLYLMFLHVLTFGAAFACGREITEDRLYGAVCGLWYTLSFYRLTDIYFRASAGEAGAMTFFPLIAAGLYCAYRMRDVTDEKKSILYLVAGATGVLQLHTIGVLLASLAIFLFFLLFFCETLQRQRLICFAKALLYVFLLNLWFIVPFTDYLLRRMFEVTASIGEVMSAMAAVTTPFSELFLLRNTDHWMSFGAAGFVTLCLGVWVALFYADEKTKRVMLRLTALTMFFLIASSDLFPYTWMLAHLPLIYDLVSTIQLAWRLLALAALLVTLLGAFSMRAIRAYAGTRDAYKGMRQAVVCGIAVTGLVSGIRFMEGYLPDAGPYQVQDSFRSACEMEFLLPDGIPEKILYYQGWPALPEAEGVTKPVQERGLGMRATVTAASVQERVIDFPRMNYYGYCAEGAQGAFAVTDGPNRNVRVLIPSGYTGEVRIMFRTPWYWHLGELISLLTAVWMIRRGRGRVPR